MEPRQSSPEQLPSTAPTPEVGPSSHETSGREVASPELGFDGRHNEQTERRLGQKVEAVARVPSQQASSITLPAPVNDNTSAPSASTSADDDVPIAAADDDLIEKEWVDKAKQVISNTKDDPYRREVEVKRLQLEYIKKRYGKIIGDSGDV